MFGKFFVFYPSQNHLMVQVHTFNIVLKIKLPPKEVLKFSLILILKRYVLSYHSFFFFFLAVLSYHSIEGIVELATNEKLVLKMLIDR